VFANQEIVEMIQLSMVIFGGSFFHGITGFGFGILALPFLIIFYNPHESIIITVTLAIINTIYLAIRTWNDMTVALVRRFVVFGIFGLPFGIYFFVNFNVTTLKLIISVIIILFSLSLLFKWSYKFKNKKFADSFVGFLSGVFQTSIGLSGIPPVVYLTIQNCNKLSFRASINAFFLFLMPCGLAIFWSLGGVDESVFYKAVPFIPIVICGQYLGIKLSKRFSQVMFRKIVIFTVMTAGIYNLAYLYLK
jgi:uncharacterized membrane protein YfcA